MKSEKLDSNVLSELRKSIDVINSTKKHLITKELISNIQIIKEITSVNQLSFGVLKSINAENCKGV